MENKKQLVLVPPMSGPFQKLNEVLQSIAEDENIEITIIDDPKELVQFIGTSGQSLVAYSNAKKCATFLQENRLVIAKNHSKFILLTPKEIPPKTLIKFIKIGLTESILESSPPKTLLYKLKLLLRSIKTSSQQETKYQVIKNTLENASTDAKSEVNNTDKSQSEEASVDYLSEERAKFKNRQEETAIDYGGSLKGKSNYQEETIETNWKSKLKTDPLLTDGSDDPSPTSIENEDSNNIDTYYRGKNKKNNSLDELEEENLHTKKNLITDEQPAESYKKDRSLKRDEELESDKTKNKKNNFIEEEDDLLSLKRNKATFDLEEPDDTSKDLLLTEEEKALAKKRDLEELEELIKEAQKRQKQEAADLGGYYKGKINNTNLEIEEEDQTTEKEDYDNSELHQREKQFDLDLIDSDDENKIQLEKENNGDGNDSHDREVDKIKTKMQAESGPVDKIDTLMTSHLDPSQIQENSNQDPFEIDSSKEITGSKTSDYKEEKEPEDDLGNDENFKDRNKNNVEEENDQNRNKQTEPDSESEPSGQTHKLEIDNGEDDQESDSKKSTKLNLIEEDEDFSKAKLEEETNMSSKKIGLAIGAVENNGRKTHDGKVDKIDTFYRSGESKKSEHNWDNLTDKNKLQNSEIKKKLRREDEIGTGAIKKDAEETTIDYRKLKEEFNTIAKNGLSIGDSIAQKQNYDLIDSDDEGSFKVIEIDTRSIEFGIEMVNLIDKKDSKPIDFFKLVSEELISHYNGYPIFYTFKISEKKHIEAFDSFMHFGDSLVSTELKEWWINAKTDQDVFTDYFTKTMTTWLCRAISNKSGNGNFWEDVELPSWAANELSDKKVEMVFPYFDGVDRMGAAILIFPNGVNSSKEKSIVMTLEMVRTVLLDSIQRKTQPSLLKSEEKEEPVLEKKNILGIVSGFFNRNKAS